MTLSEAAELVETRLDDLQAEMEAGVRCVTRLRDVAVDDPIADALRTADHAGRLMLRLTELRKSVTQQRDLMQQLRREIRSLRGKLAQDRQRRATPE